MIFRPAARANCCCRTSNVAKCLNSSSIALATCRMSSERQPIERVCLRLSSAALCQGGSPKHIPLFVASLGKVVIESVHRRVVHFVGNDPSVSGEANAVEQFDSAVMSHEKRVADRFPPPWRRRADAPSFRMIAPAPPDQARSLTGGAVTSRSGVTGKQQRRVTPKVTPICIRLDGLMPRHDISRSKGLLDNAAGNRRFRVPLMLILSQ